MPWGRRGSRALLALAVLAIGRLAFHAVFLPAYEGPDEPHHLGRIAAFADHPFREALAGVPLDGSITRAVESRPCGPTVRRVAPCPPFGSSPAAFNLLHPLPKLPDPRGLPNPENHQPPLFYIVAGLILRAATRLDPSGWLAAPDVRLLAARLFSVALVALAVFFPLRALLRTHSRNVAVVGLLLLLLPGAAESLARCSNDAAMFCWTALLLYAVARRAPLAWICLLLACGPLLKLTAFPIVAVAVACLWQQGRRRGSILGVVSAGLVFPVQWLRGWLWGGTYEFNRATPGIHETLLHAALGMIRSFYTIAKTIFWLGGWSAFRAPLVLVIAWFLLLFGLLAVARPRPGIAAKWPHILGAAAAFAGCVVFIVGHRRYYGDWGGVGGWYVWDWAPWILIAVDDLAAVPVWARRILLPATVTFVAAANLVYFVTALRIYG